jgi:hypothetical protein
MYIHGNIDSFKTGMIDEATHLDIAIALNGKFSNADMKICFA